MSAYLKRMKRRKEKRKPKAVGHRGLGQTCLSSMMSSDEEFSLLPDNDQKSHPSPLEVVRAEIEKYKVTHERLVADKKDLLKARDEQLQLAEEYRNHSVKLRTMLEEEEQERVQSMKDGKAKLAAMQEEEGRLKGQLLSMEEELRHLDEQTLHLRQEAEAFPKVPEKKVVFTGAVSEGAEAVGFHIKSHIVYPMEGGTTLITFEEDAVAQNIVRLRQHMVKLGECYIRLEAEPVQLLIPSHVEVATHVCPKRILISDVPQDVDKSRLVDKLEIHFSKSRHHGGEVEDAEMLHDDGNVVLTFVEDTVAKGLTDRQSHKVDLGSRQKHYVKVTPFLSGEITDLQTRASVPTRTVLLTGIPDIMDPVDLQDQLEIHFQKHSNGGGEVDAIVYNPPGGRTLAVFKDDCAGEEL
ncbi:hypothetical protein AAFF_G00340660 [Aldrovandia affinis]|uniref:NID domain-containing protein n=1 Tax=Aldrovandia affinis TaxID=143900 RepID=A0AAD7WPK4_9TELE|nr:hypothetical protein AAFF_G00340660 [Aldrovandia affinis]